MRYEKRNVKKVRQKESKRKSVDLATENEEGVDGKITIHFQRISQLFL